MSLWFQGAQQSTYSPEDSRTLGFGQVRKAEAPLTRQEPGRLPTAATGDPQYDFSQDLSIGNRGGNAFNFDVLENNATFDFNETHQFLNALSAQIHNLQVANSQCCSVKFPGGNVSINAVTELTLSGAGLCATVGTMVFNAYGSLISWTPNSGVGCISTTTCPT